MALKINLNEEELEILKFMPPEGHTIGSYTLLHAVEFMGKKEYSPDKVRMAYWSLVSLGFIKRVPEGVTRGRKWPEEKL